MVQTTHYTSPNCMDNPQVNMHWIHYSEKFLTVQDFSATLRLRWKAELPRKFSMYWIYVLHSGFLSNSRFSWKTELPWNFSLYWNIFYHSGFLCNFALALKSKVCPENFHCIEYTFTFSFFEQLALALKNRVCPEFAVYIFFIIQDFWATCTCLKTEFALKIFKPGRLHHASYAYACQ